MKGAEIIEYFSAKKLNLNLNLIPYTEINSKCPMDLNIKPKAIKPQM